ncbi:hypothetical protein [Mobiluncus mulieris]|uniref:hypothetical protein n=1 Tax=Mobiluncus mulieris TaxID=2052 RepID=UPI00242C21FD|nr:hypothetical protein [Mobiluncus mulieris]
MRRESDAKLYLNLGGLPRADPQDLRYGRAKMAPHEIRKSEDNRRGEHLKLAPHEPEAKQRKGD